MVREYDVMLRRGKGGGGAHHCRGGAAAVRWSLYLTPQIHRVLLEYC